MLLRSNKQTAAPADAPTAPAAEGEFEMTGGIAPVGVVAANQLPPNIQALLAKIEPESIEVSGDYKKLLRQMQQDAEANIAAKVINTADIPVKKITSMSQLSAEDRAALSSLLAQNKPQLAAPKPTEGGIGNRRFRSADELFSHALQTLKEVDVNAVFEGTVEYDGDAPVAATETKAVDTPAEQPKHEPSMLYRASQQLERCPHCDMSLLVDPADITEEQKKRFVYSILHNIPYTEDINLFGDTLTVRFKALSTFETDALLSAIDAINDKSELSSADRHSFYMRSYLVCSVAAITIGESVKQVAALKFTEDTQENIDLILQRSETISTLIPNSEIFKLISNEAVKFQFKIRQLAVKGLNADFWQPIQS